MKKTFIINQHFHYGWVSDTIKCENIDKAIEIAVLKYHEFLEKDFKGKYKIVNTLKSDPYPMAKVYWDCENPKSRIILSRNMVPSLLHKGDLWFCHPIRIGSKNDCKECGGTGINHYNPFVQCYMCGNLKLRGKGTGKKQKGGSSETKI